MRNSFVKRFYCFNEGGGDGSGGAGNTPSPTPEPSLSPQPSPAPTPPPSGGNDFSSSIPQEYRDKPYIKTLLEAENPQTEVWKQFDGLQTLLGKRPAGMPGDDAPKEEWDKWVQSIQPKDISVYGDIKPTVPEDKPHLKEYIEQSYDPKLTQGILEAARVAGITKRQMSSLMEAYNKQQLEVADSYHTQLQTQQLESQKQMDADFDKVFTQEFGSDRDKVESAAREYIAKETPENLKKHLPTLSAEALALVAGTIYSVKQKYGKEDTIPKNLNSYNEANDAISAKDALVKAMAAEEYKNPFHPRHAIAKEAVRLASENAAKFRKIDPSYT